MGWAMLYLFIVLKIPIALACWIIWWAARQEPDPADDGSPPDERRRRPHPPPHLPRAPRRGPHGGLAAQPPPRVRTVLVRSRTPQR